MESKKGATKKVADTVKVTNPQVQMAYPADPSSLAVGGTMVDKSGYLPQSILQGNPALQAAPNQALLLQQQ